MSIAQTRGSLFHTAFGGSYVSIRQMGRSDWNCGVCGFPEGVVGHAFRRPFPHRENGGRRAGIAAASFSESSLRIAKSSRRIRNLAGRESRRRNRISRDRDNLECSSAPASVCRSLAAAAAARFESYAACSTHDDDRCTTDTSARK